MAYRGIRGSDPFASKTTRNERFAQMSKQEQLIEQKKREIQAKLDNQKKKETEETLKKLQNASASSRSGSGNKSNFQSGQHKGNRKTFWKSSQDQRWKRDTSQVEDMNSVNKGLGSVNIFSNDGSFMDQFKKISGVKEPRMKKPDDLTVGTTNEIKLSAKQGDSDTDWGTWAESPDKNSENVRDQQSGVQSSSMDDEKDEDRKDDVDKKEDLHNSDRIGTSHWFQQECTGSGARQKQGQDNSGMSWSGQDSPPPSLNSNNSASNRPSSPYSPSRTSPDSKDNVPIINRSSQGNASNPSQYPHHSTSALPLLTSPPPAPRQQHFIPYAAPPPLHTIPPPSPLQPHAIPPPSPLQPHSIPTPPPHVPALGIHHQSAPIITSIQPPPTTIQPPPSLQRTPTIQPSSAPPISPLNPPQNLHRTSTLPPHLIQHPPPLLQRHTVPPPPAGVLQTRALAPGPPPPMIPPLLQHPVSPPGILPAVPASATACVPHVAVPGVASICSSPGTGVSPAALAAMQTGVGLSSGQPGDDTLNPAADEARDHLARTVAQCGDDIEQIIVTRNPDDPNLWFLKDKTSSAYRQYRNLVEKYRYEIKYNEDEEFLKKVVKDERVIVEDEAGEYGPQAFQERMLAVKTEMDNKGDLFRPEDGRSGRNDQEDDNSRQSEASSKRSGDDSDEGQASAARRRKRRSRWAPESEKVNVIPPGTTGAIPITSNVGGIQQAGAFPAGGPPAANIPFLSKLTRTDPALVQYAIQAFGSSNLSEEDWKKAEDHYKINLLYQDMLRKRQELERLQRAGKFKYEYDSDEETDGGTWEHRLRMQEMEATQRWAEELTKKAEGKHHIGDFLPPDELERFLEKYSALKEGREPDLSDYKEFKLKEDNIGFQMLQKLGWTEGQGLGSDGHGIVDPVNKASSRPDNQGLGVERPEDVSRGDDEYDAYRKRMMLAYRFRPNPLNNPRRPYY